MRARPPRNLKAARENPAKSWTCQAEAVSKISAATDCVFQDAGGMDSSKKLNLAATKTYITNHVTLTATQKTAFTTDFDSCMASPPKTSSVAPTESMTAFKCMTKSL